MNKHIRTLIDILLVILTLGFIYYSHPPAVFAAFIGLVVGAIVGIFGNRRYKLK